MIGIAKPKADRPTSCAQLLQHHITVGIYVIVSKAKNSRMEMWSYNHIVVMRTLMIYLNN